MIPMGRREFVGTAVGTVAGLAVAGRRAWGQTEGDAGGLVDTDMRERIAAYFDDLCGWIMGLDVGSNELKGTKDTKTSIFINGNFARVLMASYRIC